MVPGLGAGAVLAEVAADGGGREEVRARVARGPQHAHEHARAQRQRHARARRQRHARAQRGRARRRRRVQREERHPRHARRVRRRAYEAANTALLRESYSK